MVLMDVSYIKMAKGKYNVWCHRTECKFHGQHDTCNKKGNYLTINKFGRCHEFRNKNGENKIQRSNEK